MAFRCMSLGLGVLVMFQTLHTGLCGPKGQGIANSDDHPQASLVFELSDLNHDTLLTYGEFQTVFRIFDNDTDGNVTMEEFEPVWYEHDLGTEEEALKVFSTLDLNTDYYIEISLEVQYIWRWFDSNSDMRITEQEFVSQWVKIIS